MTKMSFMVVGFVGVNDGDVIGNRDDLGGS